MDSADIVMCRFYLNEAWCSDRHNGRFPVTPVIDEKENIQRWRSEGIYDEFVVMGFKRQPITDDESDDYKIQLGNQTDIIWAYGEYNITSGEFVKHIGYGATTIVWPNGANTFGSLHFLIICFVVMAMLLMS